MPNSIPCSSPALWEVEQRGTDMFRQASHFLTAELDALMRSLVAFGRRDNQGDLEEYIGNMLGRIHNQVGTDLWRFWIEQWIIKNCNWSDLRKRAPTGTHRTLVARTIAFGGGKRILADGSQVAVVTWEKLKQHEKTILHKKKWVFVLWVECKEQCAFESSMKKHKVPVFKTKLQMCPGTTQFCSNLCKLGRGFFEAARCHHGATVCWSAHATKVAWSKASRTARESVGIPRNPLGTPRNP